MFEMCENFEFDMVIFNLFGCFNVNVFSDGQDLCRIPNCLIPYKPFTVRYGA